VTGPRPGRGAGSGYGRLFEAIGPFVPSGLALVGLVVLAVLSVGLVTGELPSIGGNGPNGDGDGGPIRTPTPSDVIVVDPRTNVPGTIAYAKTGNIWMQSGDRAYRLTYGGQDSMPSWSRDGRWIYFVRSVPGDGRIVVDGVLRAYSLEVPTVMRFGPDDASPPQAIVAGIYQKGTATWSYYIREPVLSPDMTRLALVSDGPDPTKSNVILQFLDLATLNLTSAGAAENRPLGHQDPAWSPDGAELLYVRNGRDGSRGAPFLMRYDVPTGMSSILAGPGYIAPAWSPDGRFVVATQTDGLGTDVVILDASTGVELLRVTNDGQSFSGTWSPAGDAIAYLRIDGGVVDLQMVTLAGPGPDWTLGRTLPLTDAAGLDAASRPYWFIPPDQLPEPTPAPTPIPTPGLSASAASSAP